MSKNGTHLRKKRLNDFVIPPCSWLESGDRTSGLFASLTLRADFQSFNALRAFVRPKARRNDGELDYGLGLGSSAIAPCIALLRDRVFTANDCLWNSTGEKKPTIRSVLLYGSPGKIRTCDQRINSPLRYRCATGELRLC